MKHRKVDITPRMAEILAGLKIDGQRVVIVERLPRDEYDAVNKALIALGGKWNTRTKAHVWAEGDPKQRIAEALAAKAAPRMKQIRNAFYSPPEVAKMIVASAFVGGHVVLEPSAGIGNLARECARQGADLVDCIEIDEDASRLISADMLEVQVVHVGDFLKWKPDNDRYHRIVMNPPFERGVAWKHIDHAISACLASGGILVSLVPFNHNLPEGFERVAVVEGGAFDDTNIRTMIVRWRKP